MSTSLRWGILGTGSIAKKFASELLHSRTGRLVAIGSRTSESAAKFAEAYPGLRTHGCYEDLLTDPAVDAVYISTPHPGHAEWAIAAAEAGKHILCEKPLTLNHAEAMVVIESARRHGVFLMEAFMYKCHPRTAQIWQLIRDGAIGPVRMIRSAFSFAASFDPKGRLFNNQLGGGGILDVGCYASSIARTIAGAAIGQPFADPLALSGEAVLAETGVDLIAAATLKFPGNILAQISCGVSATHGSALEVFGDAGWLKVDSFWNPPGPIEIHTYASKQTVQIESDPSPHKYALEADAVADALPNHESKLVSWNDTLGNMRVLDQWRAASGVKYETEALESTWHALPHSRRPLRADRYAEIPKAFIPGLAKPVSRLVLGVDNQLSAPQMAAMGDDFVERGGNAFDTAFIYGGGLPERLLGRWMESRGVREQMAVIVKGAHTPECHPKALRDQFQQSLERLRTDHADIYIMHRDNPEIPAGEFVDVLDELRSAGKIGVYGGSNWSMARLREANEYAARTGKQPFKVVSNNLSLAQMVDPVWGGCVSAKGPEWREFLRESGLTLLAWSSQARGYFVSGSLADDLETLRCWDSPENQERRRRAITLAAGRGVTAINIALAYVLSQPYPSFALFGPRSIEETRTSLPGANFVLSPEELAWLDLETDKKP